MDSGAWWTTVYGTAKSWTGLSDYHTHTHTFDPSTEILNVLKFTELSCSFKRLTLNFIL